MIKKVDILGIQLDNYTVHIVTDADRFGDKPGIKGSYEFPGSCNHWRERDYSGSGA